MKHTDYTKLVSMHQDFINGVHTSELDVDSLPPELFVEFEASMKSHIVRTDRLAGAAFDDISFLD